MFEIHVTYRGRDLRRRTINERMEEADPGHWGIEHPLCYSCPTMAAYAADLIRDTFGKGYNVSILP